jgi:hypothetical protein
MKIYETDNFEVVTHEKPFVSREEGGHIKIVAKDGIPEITQLPLKIAIEYMRLLQIVGKAYPTAMKSRGVNVIWMNYATLGNWAFKKDSVAENGGVPKPHFHTQIFGRTLNAQKQPFPEAVYLPARESGFYDDFIPLNEGDVTEVARQIEIVSATEKYNPKNWGLR